jgi:carboxyl-terminal processing protease
MEKENQRETRNRILFSLLFIIDMVAAFGLGWLVHDRLNPSELALPILARSYEIIENHGFYELPPEPSIEYGMIYGMVEAYGDPFTRFVEPPQHELETDTLSGEYGGIGATVRISEDNHILLYPYPGSPAAEAGVLDGDRLIAVEDTEITVEISLDDVVAMVRGPVGQRVRISILRPPDDEKLDFNIKRGKIALPSVSWYLALDEERLGVIQINLIASTTPDEIKAAVKDLEARGAEKYVLDLRDNLGGLLTEGTDIAQLFLKDGVIIEQVFSDDSTKEFEVIRPGELSDLEMVVLVNEYTASAAEIIAGSIQAHGRAPIIGTTTYGKNTVQLVFDLEDGSSLHITSAEWRLPGLEFPTENGGLIPETIVPPDAEGVDPALSIAIQTLFFTE